MRQATVLFILGLALVPIGIGGLAGLWWAILAAGLECIGVAVLTAADIRREPGSDVREPAQ